MSDFVVVGLFMQLAILMVAMISLMRDRTVIITSVVAWVVLAVAVGVGVVDCEILRPLITGRGIG